MHVNTARVQTERGGTMEGIICHPTFNIVSTIARGDGGCCVSGDVALTLARSTIGNSDHGRSLVRGTPVA
jgi:hypothetical protein